MKITGNRAGKRIFPRRGLSRWATGTNRFLKTGKPICLKQFQKPPDPSYWLAIQLVRKSLCKQQMSFQNLLQVLYWLLRRTLEPRNQASPPHDVWPCIPRSTPLSFRHNRQPKRPFLRLRCCRRHGRKLGFIVHGRRRIRPHQSRIRPRPLPEGLMVFSRFLKNIG